MSETGVPAKLFASPTFNQHESNQVTKQNRKGIEDGPGITRAREVRLLSALSGFASTCSLAKCYSYEDAVTWARQNDSPFDCGLTQDLASLSTPRRIRQLRLAVLTS